MSRHVPKKVGVAWAVIDTENKNMPRSVHDTWAAAQIEAARLNRPPIVAAEPAAPCCGCREALRVLLDCTERSADPAGVGCPEEVYAAAQDRARTVLAKTGGG